MSTDGELPVKEDVGPDPEPAAAGSEPASGTETAAGDEAFRTGVSDALAAITARLDREHERAAHREAVIDRLHEENQRLKRGELQEMLEPVRAALYRLHDNARRESDRLGAPETAGPVDPKQAALLLEALADDVADALARLGVERFTVEPGAPYDAARHRPVAVTPVTDPLRDGTVTAVRSDGFAQGAKVLRKASVSVGKHAPPQDPANDPAQERAGRGPGPKDHPAEDHTANDDYAMNSGFGTDR